MFCVLFGYGDELWPHKLAYGRIAHISPRHALRVGLGLLLVLCAYSSWAAEWSQYGGEGGQQFTPLTQVNAENVEQLSELWRFRTGDLGQGFKRKGHSMQANPVLWNRTLYISTSANWVVAVDAVTGAEKWRFDAELPKDIALCGKWLPGVSLGMVRRQSARIGCCSAP